MNLLEQYQHKQGAGPYERFADFEWSDLQEALAWAGAAIAARASERDRCEVEMSFATRRDDLGEVSALASRRAGIDLIVSELESMQGEMQARASVLKRSIEEQESGLRAVLKRVAALIAEVGGLRTRLVSAARVLGEHGGELSAVLARADSLKRYEQRAPALTQVAESEAVTALRSRLEGVGQDSRHSLQKRLDEIAENYGSYRNGEGDLRREVFEARALLGELDRLGYRPADRVGIDRRLAEAENALGGEVSEAIVLMAHSLDQIPPRLVPVVADAARRMQAGPDALIEYDGGAGAFFGEMFRSVAATAKQQVLVPKNDSELCLRCGKRFEYMQGFYRVGGGRVHEVCPGLGRTDPQAFGVGES